MNFSRQLVIALISLILAGCAGLSIKPIEPGSSQPTADIKAGTTPAPRASPTTILVLTPTVMPPSQLRLKIWVPPQFDPSADTPSGRLLRQRLDGFNQRRPDVVIDVRVKGLDGPGGEYESLATATSAAQGAMPDLILIPHSVLQMAAVKGLLRPMNGLTNVLDDSDWYDYARQVAGLQNSIFGLPFAGDALVQVYHPGTESQPYTGWQSVLDGKTPLAFPAADPLAVFTLAMYQAAGGKILDEQGRPVLEVEPLTKVLDFYKSGQAIGTIPAWLAQTQTDDQTWQAFMDDRAGTAAVWLSKYFQKGLENSAIAEIPTPSGEALTLARGWAWALTSPDAQRRQLAVQLAEFLTDADFMGKWSQAAGMLPARSSAFKAWNSENELEQLKAIAASSHLYPSTEASNILGPALEDAAVAVLKGQLGAGEAAQTAVKQVSNPK